MDGVILCNLFVDDWTAIFCHYSVYCFRYMVNHASFVKVTPLSPGIERCKHITLTLQLPVNV